MFWRVPVRLEVTMCTRTAQNTKSTTFQTISRKSSCQQKFTGIYTFDTFNNALFYSILFTVYFIF